MPDMPDLLDWFEFVFHGDSVVMGMVGFLAAIFGLLALRWSIIAANLKAVGNFLAPWVKPSVNTVLTVGTTTLVLVATGIIPAPHRQSPPDDIATAAGTAKSTGGKTRVGTARAVPAAETTTVPKASTDHAAQHHVATDDVDVHMAASPSAVAGTPPAPEQPSHAAPEVAEPNIDAAELGCPSFGGRSNPLEACALL
jgi:hypothetical protein